MTVVSKAPMPYLADMVPGAIDEQTRCKHYHSSLDIIAIKFKCCDTFYPCIHCHEELAGHPALTWGKQEQDEPAVLCGACKTVLSVKQYLQADNACPACGAAFNPGCSKHHHFYFET